MGSEEKEISAMTSRFEKKKSLQGFEKKFFSYPAEAVVKSVSLHTYVHTHAHKEVIG